jgi:hypothetical protein
MRIGVLLVLAGMAGGYYVREWTFDMPEPEVRTITVEKRVEVAGAERIVFRDRVIEVEKETHPDGTVVEHTTTHEQEHEKEETTTVSEKVATSTATSTSTTPDSSLADTLKARPEYSVSVGYRQHLSLDSEWKPDWSKVEVGVGRRLIGDIWGEASYHPGTNTGTIGVRCEF